VNHNGKIDLAFKLIELAKKSGADAVKFQNFQANRLVMRSAKKAPYQVQNIGKKISQFDMLKKLELRDEEFYKIKKFCDKKKIEFISTPYNFEDIDFLTKINVKTIKLASMHLFEPDFIKYASSKSKYLIMSTGMAFLNDVRRAYKIIKNKSKLMIMQCTTDYPSDETDANLNVISKYKELFKCSLGYSDHTLGSDCAMIAVAKGAVALEKHFTLSNNFLGPDHKASLNPKDFKNYVSKIRKTEKILGNGIKVPTLKEKKNESAMRRSVIASKFFERNSKISLQDVVFKRPFNGISPYNFFLKRNKFKTKYKVKKNTVLREDIF
jgi:N,N'-diacetyllegionaminate synthase